MTPSQQASFYKAVAGYLAGLLALAAAFTWAEKIDNDRAKRLRETGRY